MHAYAPARRRPPAGRPGGMAPARVSSGVLARSWYRDACTAAPPTSAQFYWTVNTFTMTMEYITLPGTDLKVSRICLGTMQFSNSWEWPCDQATATAVVDAAIKAGVNFFDTAQVSSQKALLILPPAPCVCVNLVLTGPGFYPRRLTRSTVTAAPKRCWGLR